MSDEDAAKVRLAESCVTCKWGEDTHLMGDVWCTRYGILRSIYLSCADYEPKLELKCRVTGEP